LASRHHRRKEPPFGLLLPERRNLFLLSSNSSSKIKENSGDVQELGFSSPGPGAISNALHHIAIGAVQREALEMRETWVAFGACGERTIWCRRNLVANSPDCSKISNTLALLLEKRPSSSSLRRQSRSRKRWELWTKYKDFLLGACGLSVAATILSCSTGKRR
jgi:hypothetical protein